MKVLYVYLFVCVNVLDGYDNALLRIGESEISFSKPSTFESRPKDCKPLPDMTLDANYQYLMSAMNGEHIATAWLPMKRVSFNGFYWLDGSFYASRISDPVWVKPGMDCVVLRTSDKMLDDVLCNNLYHYYACQTPGSTCRSMTDAHRCIEFINTTYTIHYDTRKTNWYYALEECHLRGAELATVKSSGVLGAIKDAMQSANVWIGLRRAEYQMQPSNKTVKRFLGNTNAPDPCNCPENKCGIMKRYTASQAYYWQQVLCNETHSHICLDVLHTPTKPTVSTPGQESKTNTPDKETPGIPTNRVPPPQSTIIPQLPTNVRTTVPDQGAMAGPPGENNTTQYWVSIIVPVVALIVMAIVITVMIVLMRGMAAKLRRREDNSSKSYYGRRSYPQEPVSPKDTKLYQHHHHSDYHHRDERLGDEHYDGPAPGVLWSPGRYSNASKPLMVSPGRMSVPPSSPWTNY